MRLRLALVVLACSVTASYADRIDGDWCSSTGKHVLIEGPAITLPSGAEIIGDYRRHTFSYEAPDGDPEAGQVVEMRQLSDEEMVVVRRRAGAADPAETWKRCQATS